MLVRRNANGTLGIRVYRKQTHRDQILDCHSNHPNNHKRSCIRTSFRRPKTHCSTKGLGRQEEIYVFKMLERNRDLRHFVRRRVHAINKETSRMEPSNRRIIKPYIKVYLNWPQNYFHLKESQFLINWPKIWEDSKTKRTTEDERKNKSHFQSQVHRLWHVLYRSKREKNNHSKVRDKSATRRHDPLPLISVQKVQ